MNLSNSQQICACLGNGMQIESYRCLVPKPGRPRARTTIRIRALPQSKHNFVTRIRLDVIQRRIIRKALRISQKVSKPGHANDLKVMSPLRTGEPQVPKPKPRLSKPELLAQDYPLLGNKEIVLQYIFSQGYQLDTSALSYRRLCIVTNYVAGACDEPLLSIPDYDYECRSAVVEVPHPWATDINVEIEDYSDSEESDQE